jgi:hypothetical protein
LEEEGKGRGAGVGEERKAKKNENKKNKKTTTKKINIQAQSLNVIHIRHKPYTGGTLLGMCIPIHMKYHCNIVWKIMHIVFV